MGNSCCVPKAGEGNDPTALLHDHELRLEIEELRQQCSILEARRAPSRARAHAPLTASSPVCQHQPRVCGMCDAALRSVATDAFRALLAFAGGRLQHGGARRGGLGQTQEVARVAGQLRHATRPGDEVFRRRRHQHRADLERGGGGGDVLVV